jgi:hypothetical protein
VIWTCQIKRDNRVISLDSKTKELLVTWILSSRPYFTHHSWDKLFSSCLYATMAITTSPLTLPKERSERCFSKYKIYLSFFRNAIYALQILKVWLNHLVGLVMKDLSSRTSMKWTVF